MFHNGAWVAFLLGHTLDYLEYKTFIFDFFTCISEVIFAVVPVFRLYDLHVLDTPKMIYTVHVSLSKGSFSNLNVLTP